MKAFAALALFYVAIAASAQAALPDAVRVRLFSAESVASAAFTPAGGNSSYRAYADSKWQPAKTPLSVAAVTGGIQVNGSQRAHQVELRGSFRATANGRTAAVFGAWNIHATKTDLIVIVSVPLERYVEAAVNGEAAPDEPDASLAAMAIVARTFAVTNLRRHAAEGFDLCDSTHCEALQAGSIRPQVRQAVHETEGETLWFGDTRAKVFTSQHCGGRTESAAAAWGTKNASYLASQADPYCVRRSSAEWHAEVRNEDVLAWARSEHWRLPPRIDEVRIVQKTDSGRVRMLRISGAGQSAMVSASSLRFAVDRNQGWNVIRSDWYKVEEDNSRLIFSGRGFGHGVGLCQAGSFQMAHEGHSAQQILGFYFPGTHIGLSASDRGWQEHPATGWKLVSVSSDADWIRAGDEAWARAKTLLPVTETLSPLVRVAPSVEMFRQSTGQPGWLLAATDGHEITVQPLAVVQAHGGVQDLLLHEFLHVLVEARAGSAAPLWLREGLVETLAGTSSAAMPSSIHVAELEEMLAHPATQAASQRAHAAAASYVAMLVQRFGRAHVMAWLSAGVPREVLAQMG